MIPWDERDIYLHEGWIFYGKFQVNIPVSWILWEGFLMFGLNADLVESWRKHTRKEKQLHSFFGKQSPKRSISPGPLLPSHPPSRDSWAATCLIDQWSSGSPKGETQCYRPVMVTWCHMVTAGLGKWKVCSPLQQWKSANTTKNREAQQHNSVKYVSQMQNLPLIGQKSSEPIGKVH